MIIKLINNLLELFFIGSISLSRFGLSLIFSRGLVDDLRSLQGWKLLLNLIIACFQSQILELQAKELLVKHIIDFFFHEASPFDD